MAASNPTPLWSVDYIYAPGVPNPSSPSVPSSMSSSAAPDPVAAALPAGAVARSLTTAAAPPIPQHWRRVIMECRVEPLEDPNQPGQGVSEADLLDWVCQILSGELRERGPHIGTPALTLLRKAILSLPDTERAEFFDGLRRLKKPGHHAPAAQAPAAAKPAKAGKPAAGKKSTLRKKPRK